MHNEEITINYEDIINQPDNSITDPETIRQIALYGIKYQNSSLYRKIKSGYEFCGLYPNIQRNFSKLDFTPVNKMREDLLKKRLKSKE